VDLVDDRNYQIRKRDSDNQSDTKNEKHDKRRNLKALAIFQIGRQKISSSPN
jgi:hypothetical protein